VSDANWLDCICCLQCLCSPQPMLVQEVHIGTCGFQLDSFYVDERSLTATTTRVSSHFSDTQHLF
jgi:hypothetical protein